jgi:sugar phosphate isomerase/epimerase
VLLGQLPSPGKIAMKVDRRTFAQSCGVVGAVALASPFAPVNARHTTQRSGIPPFKLGLVTYNMAARWDVPTILKVCKAVGIGPVELRTQHAHGVEPSLGPEARKKVRDQFADAGIGIWGLGTTCEFQAVDAAVVKKNIESCKAFIQLAADLGARGVKVRPNGIPRGAELDKTLEQIGKALIECGEAGAGQGIEVFVEVHGGTTQIPANMKKIMEHCGHKNVGLTWNSNPTDVVNGSVAPSFKLLQPWIRSCHINELWKDATGAYPYRELFRLLRESGYDRATLIEVGKSPPDAATGEELLRYYKALWTNLAC